MPRLSEADRETRLSSAEPEGARERREFRQTAIYVVAAHVLVLVVFAITAKFQPKAKIEQIQWLDGGLLGGGDPGAASAPPPEPEPPTPPPPDPVPEPPPPAPATSDLAVPKATPPPATPVPATPKPATPKPATPKPSSPTPKPKPKTTTKPTPKATPKKSASPKPEASPKASVKASPKPAAKTDADGTSDSPNAAKPGAAKGPAMGDGKGKGTAGTGPGAGKPSDFGWYFSGLRDRYYAVWAPPSVADSASLVVTLKIRVKRDGTVLGHELIKSSGNSLMDGSVLAAAEQVTKIDPLPPGLGKEDIVEIPINFKPE